MVPVAAKAGALLAVAAAGSTSIWYFSDSIFGKGVVSVADETDQSPYGSGPIKTHTGYFLSSKENQKIWEERYKENQNKFAKVGETDNASTKAKDKFGTVTEGYSVDKGTALNKICEEAYKLTESDKLSTDEPTGNDDTNKFAIPNIWKFCSIGGIVTVSEDKEKYKPDTFTTSKIGGDDNNKKIFVSAKSDKNQWFWKLREEEFRKESGDRSNAKSQGSSKENNVFKKLAAKDPGDQIKTLSDACHSAYEKETNSDTNHKNKEDAELFCSIKLTIPTGSQA